MTAEAIARALVAKPITDARIVKAKYQAWIGKVEWAAVLVAVETVTADAKTALQGEFTDAR